jgi:hypothetical protein
MDEYVAMGESHRNLKKGLFLRLYDDDESHMKSPGIEPDAS